MNRRHFLRSSLAASLALPYSVRALEADNPYRKNIGIQLYTLRNQIKEDLAGTIRAVAEAGYRQVESYGFPDDKARELIQAARDHGMEANSSHFAWESVTNPEKQGVPEFKTILDQAKEAGLSHLVIPYLHADNRKTLDDYKRVADRCNAAATAAKQVGVQLSYHNHAFEFQPLNNAGRTGFDIFAESFAPEMQFEVDVFWVKVGGVEPVDLIRKLSGRVSQLHLKDLKDGIALPEFGSLPPDAFQELGDGIIPMEPILLAAAEANVAHCHVEQDQSPDPIASIGQSLRHLRSL